jgi:hypothetical protein
MALPQPILAPMDPNLFSKRALARKRTAPQKVVGPSPLRKQSDYQLVAPLKATSTVSSKPPPAPSSAANQRQESAEPKTPKASARDRKKKLLCATPPVTLQDTRGRTEYDRGRQLGEGGFARCFLVQNKEGELFAAKTVAKKSLQSQKMKAKVCCCFETMSNLCLMSIVPRRNSSTQNHDPSKCRQVCRVL